MTIFDIETRPRLDLVEQFTKPFPQFDPHAVKMGNIKDEKLRTAKLVEKATEHAAEHDAYWAKARDQAGLNPLTAEVVCIGMSGDNSGIIHGDEAAVLKEFWDLYLGNLSSTFVYWSGCGFPGIGFDPKMLIKRSWRLGVKVPNGVISGRYLSNRFMDLASMYLMFVKEDYCKLTEAAEEMDLFAQNPALTRKSDTDVITGKTFHLFWDGLAVGNGTSEEQRVIAKKYLKNDVSMLEAIANRML